MEFTQGTYDVKFWAVDDGGLVSIGYDNQDMAEEASRLINSNTRDWVTASPVLIDTSNMSVKELKNLIIDLVTCNPKNLGKFEYV